MRVDAEFKLISWLACGQEMGLGDACVSSPRDRTSTHNLDFSSLWTHHGYFGRLASSVWIGQSCSLPPCLPSDHQLLSPDHRSGCSSASSRQVWVRKCFYMFHKRSGHKSFSKVIKLFYPIYYILSGWLQTMCLQLKTVVWTSFIAFNSHFYFY